ncbi:fimbrial protein [Providencia rettgeri]|uniref:fimbrial protein n=1 Tax=Providencia rettgeri TaxID=587 RepID=UPI0034E089CA
MNGRRLKVICGWNIHLFFLILISTNAYSDVSTLSINVRVIVLSTTCDIKNLQGGDTIEVDFKDITKKGIENESYNFSVPFKITCRNGSPVLSLKLTGDRANFDPTLLKSVNNENLGFEFKLANKKFPLGTVSSFFTTGTVPSLLVRPRLNSASNNIQAGSFTSAAAKLILQYE